MPLYEYACKECGLRFERRQSFNDDPITICPECDGKVVRLIQPAGIIFKGSGFYVTDNRSKSATAVPGKRNDEAETNDTKSTSESSSESKSTSTSSSTGKSKSTD